MLVDADYILESGKPIIPMTSRCDEVEDHMDTVVAEPRVTLDTGLFSQDIIVLPLEVSTNLGKAEFVN